MMAPLASAEEWDARAEQALNRWLPPTETQNTLVELAASPHYWGHPLAAETFPNPLQEPAPTRAAPSQWRSGHGPAFDALES
ncbi:hypothetical protein MAIT1_04493 [Magnetofaba australis IT-1]|uniref:Uncharacterized protein n=2 Tax=Magnetofaba TaxID=1472292 RepID=A0A1Y2K974_9PROT|nr:hypothetical protein MAIT1_04493 [Magnetofaba australis IT-1]